MEKTTLPASVRKYIRKEKARIRKGTFALAEQKKAIEDLYARFATYGSKRNAQEKDKPKKQERKGEAKAESAQSQTAS